jgi:hypothetical protein
MGLIGKILGGQGGVAAVGGAVGGAVRDVAEVFTASATKQMELSAAAQQAALAEMGAEFATAGESWFDRAVNGLNRLPRPCLALGTVGLFAYAMVDPASFSTRMQGLNAVPEPLWWLLGAVVAFYFGARETHYFRASKMVAAPMQRDEQKLNPSASENAALHDWQSGGR